MIANGQWIGIWTHFLFVTKGSKFKFQSTQVSCLTSTSGNTAAQQSLCIQTGTHLTEKYINHLLMELYCYSTCSYNTQYLCIALTMQWMKFFGSPAFPKTTKMTTQWLCFDVWITTENESNRSCPRGGPHHNESHTVLLEQVTPGCSLSSRVKLRRTGQARYFRCHYSPSQMDSIATSRKQSLHFDTSYVTESNTSVDRG